MLVFILFVITLIILSGIFFVFAEKDNELVHVAEYEKLIHIKKNVLNAPDDEIKYMEKQLEKIKKQYYM